MKSDQIGAATRLAELLILAAERGILKRAVLSKSDDIDVKRAELRSVVLSRGAALQLEVFTSDNKAHHRNIMLPCKPDDIESVIACYKQVNLLTTVGDCEYRRSKSGNSTIIGDKKLRDVMLSEQVHKAEKQTNDRKKTHILSGDEPFLKLLGVSDANGRVYDKKQSKFRQINKFLEHIEQIEKHLPNDSIRICDLCCGKSYLSFAVYHYFAVIKGMRVRMTGVDLKADVIEYCSQVTKELGFEGLEFVCGDINEYLTDESPQLVISLHACDTATDIVLNKAAEWGADVILSTPCCHHELNHTLRCPELDFIAGYSMLRQKLCDAATDAMRLKLLEARGYTTAALELIDPEETPKNIMLRAIRRHGFDPDGAEARKLMQEYSDIREFLIRS
ncbi:MAG: SAM-dependent methyltransferase [Clostridia bacterium]|nr:SAM-dependent methyltransferase [Clostridia bacterium]